MLIPVEHIAKVIGKQGAGLKHIREMTGCSVQVQQNDGQTESRRMDLSGHAGQVAAAFQLLANKAFPGAASESKLYVPAERVGQIVGRGGENLRKAREVCNVRVQVEREPVVDPGTNKEERLVTLCGESAQLAVALRCVLGPGPGPQAGVPPGGRGVGAPGPYAGAGGPGYGPMPGGGGFPGMGMMQMPGMAGGMGAPQPVNMNQGDVQVHLSVPGNVVGAVIGKGGEQIKQTAAAAGGIRISMTNRTAGERRAVCVGPYSQVVAALRMLHEQMAQAAAAAGQELSETSIVYFVKKEDAGAVIGKQGATLKEVRETSRAKIQLARDEMDGLRPCHISGPFQNVMQAQDLIFETAEPGAAVEANRQLAANEPLGPPSMAPPSPDAVPPAVAAAWH